MNAILEDDKYPIPNIKHILEQLKGKSIFSTVDLTEGYLQFPITKKINKKLPSYLKIKYICLNVLPLGSKRCLQYFKE